MVISVLVYQDDTTEIVSGGHEAVLTQDESGGNGTLEPAEKDSTDG